MDWGDGPVLELIDGDFPSPVLSQQLRSGPHETGKFPDDETPVVLDPRERREGTIVPEELLESRFVASSTIEDERDGRLGIHP